MKIPMLDLRREYDYMKADIDAAIQRCLEHQQWILGPEVAELEEKIARYLSVKHCIGISSGTDALVLALRALAIHRKGKEYFDRVDKIITTAFTFTATGDSILRAGATPVFVDIDPRTYNIDPKQIKQALQSVKGVVGILPVHLYGQACEMDQILSLGKQYNCFVVEDVAQAFGGEWWGQKLGSLGDVGAFSFFPTKNLGGFGDGGMVATNDAALAELVRMLTKHGGRSKYNADHIGYNARLDTLQAAILLVKLKYLDAFNERRKKIAREYSTRLKNIPGLEIPPEESGHVYHQYTVRIQDGKRDALHTLLDEMHIDTMIYYPVLLSKMGVFEKNRHVVGSLKESVKAIAEVLSLPVEPLLRHEEIICVCDSIKKML